MVLALPLPINYLMGRDNQLPKQFNPVSITALEESNRNGSSCVETFVKLEFEHEGMLCQLKRSIQTTQNSNGSIKKTKTVELISKRSNAKPEIKTNPAEIDEIIALILDSRLKDYFLLDGDKIIDLSQTDIQKPLQVVHKEPTKEIREKISQVATDLSRQLLAEWEQRHVNRIAVSENYSIEVTDENGNSCFGILPAGQRQVVSLCFIIALAKILTEENSQEMPFVMDSPFMRLASEYRRRIVEKLPGLLNQWILIAHEAEIAAEGILILKKLNRLNRLYVLEQSEIRNSIIKELDVGGDLTDFRHI